MRPVTGFTGRCGPGCCRNAETVAAGGDASDRRPAATEVPAAAAPVPVPVPETVGAGGQVWVVAAVRLGVAPQVVLPRADCWIIDGQVGPAGALTTEDCRRMLAIDPQASACEVCDTRAIQVRP